jgi:hypothetical protein
MVELWFFLRHIHREAKVGPIEHKQKQVPRGTPPLLARRVPASATAWLASLRRPSLFGALAIDPVTDPL